jgi:probable phosphoglycerate mutase
VQTRAVQALEKLSQEHDKETIVVVSHADVIRLVLAHYLGVHIDLFQRIVISPGAASLLALPANGSMRVLRLNDDGPLQPPADKPEDEKRRRKRNLKRRQKPTLKQRGRWSWMKKNNRSQPLISDLRD